MRTLAVPTSLVRALHEQKARQTGERMLAGSEWQDDDLVFAQANGRPIDKKVDYKPWRDCSGRSEFGTSGCTTAGTPRPRSCCPRASTLAW
ncbi:MAG: hypothetical protein ACR2LX_01960 [Jatrophihabitans sp.]